MTTNVSGTCNEAADLLEVQGWTVGANGWGLVAPTESEPLCVEGAIAAALGRHFLGLSKCPAYIAVAEHIGVRSLWRWNDGLIYQQRGNPFPDFTPESREWATEQVIATLRAVAVIHAAREESEQTATVEAVQAVSR